MKPATSTHTLVSLTPPFRAENQVWYGTAAREANNKGQIYWEVSLIRSFETAAHGIGLGGCSLLRH